MKKLLASLITAALVLAVGSIAAKAAVDLGSGFSLNGTGNIGFYAASQKLNSVDTESTADQASYRFELYLNKSFEDGGRAVLRLRGGDRDRGNLGLGNFRGAVNDQSFEASINNKAGTERAASHDLVQIRELYFIQPLFDKIAYFKIGKMSPPTSSNNALNSVGSFFTDDATIQNLNGINGSYGAEVGATPVPLVTLSYTFLGQDGFASNSNGINTGKDDSGPFTYGYHTFLANFKPVPKGNYRVGFWASTIKTDVLDSTTGEEDGASGIYLSIDQVVADNFNLGLRFGQRLDKTYSMGESVAGMHWEIGGTVSGKLWNRAFDAFFLGVGQASYQKDIKGVGVDNPEPELHLEVNYVFGFNDSFSLTPFFQYAGNINTTGSAGNYEYQTGMAYGLRTQIKF
jgi:hypothetical protein